MTQIPDSWLRLSDKWNDKLASLPEARMGSQVVSVKLKDGRRFSGVIVIAPYIYKVPGHETIPFAADDI